MSLTIVQRQELIEQLARRIADWGMIAPAVLFLQIYKPLSFLGAQALWVAAPFVNGVFKSADWRALALLMEDELGIAALIARLESWPKDETGLRWKQRT